MEKIPNYRSLDRRNFDELKQHYLIEKELATRLRYSSKSERRILYNTLYDELYTRVPNHTQISRRNSLFAQAWIVTQRYKLLKHYLKSHITFLELGAGDCSLSLKIAENVNKVYAVDVSSKISQQSLKFPKNLEFILSDGCNIPIPQNSVNIAYSHQLMEHLHPEDALEQLQNIYDVIAPGGKYICITPNRLSGPHDISRHFDEISSGFHLKEYTLSELYDIFIQAGFKSIVWVKNNGFIHINIPVNQFTLCLISLIETFLAKLPFSVRRKLSSAPLLFRGMTIVGMKQ